MAGKDSVQEQARSIPVFGGFDVIVVGGGVAGACAAVAAAREGCRTVVIEKETVPGGLATLGLVAYYLPLCDGAGHQVAGGLAEEMLRLSIKYGPGEIPQPWRDAGSTEERKKQRYALQFNPPSFALAIEEWLLGNGIRLVYDTRFCSVLMHGKRIDSVVVENKSGRMAFQGGVVIDASGDADVCACAGEDTCRSSDNKRSGWYFELRGGSPALIQGGPAADMRLQKNERGYAGDDFEDVSEMVIDSRNTILDLVRNALSPDRTEGYPVMIPSIPQLRFTRRLSGLMSVREGDDGAKYNDCIGNIGDWRKPGPVYQIPYRALIGKNVDNLIACGRCISATDSGGEIIRSIPGCAITGQAAGVAAWLAVRDGQSVGNIDIQELQKTLRKQGALIKQQNL